MPLPALCTCSKQCYGKEDEWALQLSGIFYNGTAAEVILVNRENGRTAGFRSNYGWSTDIWIPWAAGPSDYTLHHLELRVTSPTQQIYYIWQCADKDGDHVRYNTEDSYVGRDYSRDPGPAQHVPGYSYVNGNRAIVVHADGSFEFNMSG